MAGTSREKVLNSIRGNGGPVSSDPWAIKKQAISTQKSGGNYNSSENRFVRSVT